MSFPNIDWKTFGVICRVALLYNWLVSFSQFWFCFQGLFFTVPSTTTLALAFLIPHTTGWNVHNTLGFYCQFGYDLTWLISSYLAREHQWNTYSWINTYISTCMFVDTNPNNNMRIDQWICGVILCNHLRKCSFKT